MIRPWSTRSAGVSDGKMVEVRRGEAKYRPYCRASDASTELLNVPTPSSPLGKVAGL